MTTQQSFAPVSEKRVFSISEACQRVGIGRTRLYGEIKEGRLRVRKCGRRTLIRAEELDAWLDSLEG